MFLHELEYPTMLQKMIFTVPKSFHEYLEDVFLFLVKVVMEICFSENLFTLTHDGVFVQREHVTLYSMPKSQLKPLENIGMSVCTIFHDHEAFFSYRERYSGSRNLLQDMALGALYLVIGLSLPQTTTLGGGCVIPITVPYSNNTSIDNIQQIADAVQKGL